MASIFLISTVRNVDTAGVTADTQAFTAVNKYNPDHFGYVITL